MEVEPRRKPYITIAPASWSTGANVCLSGKTSTAPMRFPGLPQWAPGDNVTPDTRVSVPAVVGTSPQHMTKYVALGDRDITDGARLTMKSE